jgi:hypothetical protein
MRLESGALHGAPEIRHAGRRRIGKRFHPATDPSGRGRPSRLICLNYFEYRHANI